MPNRRISTISKSGNHRRTYLNQGLKEKRKIPRVRIPKIICAELRGYSLRRRYRPKKTKRRRGLFAIIGLLQTRDLPQGLKRKRQRTKRVV